MYWKYYCMNNINLAETLIERKYSKKLFYTINLPSAIKNVLQAIQKRLHGSIPTDEGVILTGNYKETTVLGR